MTTYNLNLSPNAIHPVSINKDYDKPIVMMDEVTTTTTTCTNSSSSSRAITPQKVFLVQGIKRKGDEFIKPLETTRNLFIKQYAKTVTCGWRATNKFQIFNTAADCIYFGIEDTNIIRKLFCRGSCPFDIKVLSLKGDTVFQIKGQTGCCASVLVKDWNGHTIGTITPDHNNFQCTPRFSLRNFDDIEILTLEGPAGANCCCSSWNTCGNVEFDLNLVNPDNMKGQRNVIGKISHEWSLSAIESVCGVRFPMKIDSHVKALLLGALFLLDFNFYNRKEENVCCIFKQCLLCIVIIVLFLGCLILIVQ